MNISKKQSAVLATFLALSSFVLLNLISRERFFRWDLTKDKKYTLSQASVETMQQLEDMVLITGYFTEGLPSPYASYSKYVQDLLDEYRSVAKDKLAYEFIDPAYEESAADKAKKKEATRDVFGRLIREPTQVENELMGLGIEPVEIRVIEDDQQQTKRAYMGLLIRYQGKKEVLPLVQDINNLERELTTLIRKLTRSKKPVMALVQDLPQASLAKWRSLITQNVELKDFNFQADSKSLEGADALAIVGLGKSLTAQALESVDAFMAQGKPVALLIDRYELNPQTFQLNSPSSSSLPIFDWLAKKGFELDDGLIADVNCASLSVTEQRGAMSFSLPVKYPFIPELINLDQQASLTRGLVGNFLPFVSPIIMSPEKKAEKLRSRVLAKSSKSSWIEPSPVDTNPRRQWLKDNIAMTGPYPLIVETTIKGKQDKPDSRLLLIGSSAFTWDAFMGGQNQNLALNVANWLTADAALLQMQARAFVELPLNPDVPDEMRTLVKYGNMIGMPFLLSLYGLIRWRIRERRRHTIQLD